MGGVAQAATLEPRRFIVSALMFGAATDGQWLRARSGAVDRRALVSDSAGAGNGRR